MMVHIWFNLQVGNINMWRLRIVPYVYREPAEPHVYQYAIVESDCWYTYGPIRGERVEICLG